MSENDIESTGRRNFIKAGTTIGAVTAVSPTLLFPSDPEQFHIRDFHPRNLIHLEKKLFTGVEIPNCDMNYFKAAPLIRYTSDGTGAYVNVLPKGKLEMDIEWRDGIKKDHSTFGYTGKGNSEINKKNPDPNPDRNFISIKPKYVITDQPINLPVGVVEDSKITYMIKFREPGKKKWKYSDEFVAVTPLVDVNNGGVINTAYIGDMHLADDADPYYGEHKDLNIKNNDLRKMRLNGDIVNYFLIQIQNNSNYSFPGEEIRLGNARSNALTMNDLLKSGFDFNGIYLMGDFNPFGFGHQWGGFGLPAQLSESITEKDRQIYSAFFQLYMRKILSILSPFFEINYVLGNHDGEKGYDHQNKDHSRSARKKFFPHPECNGGSMDGYWQNYYVKKYGYIHNSENENNLAVFVLDSEGYIPDVPKDPYGFTLGEEQRNWFERKLVENQHLKNKQVLLHRSVGSGPGDSRGWFPRERNEKGEYPWDKYAYSRFFFDENDVHEINLKFGHLLLETLELDKLEQMWFVDTCGNFDVDVYFGHDHISKTYKKTSRNGHKINVTCVGASKQIQEVEWAERPIWIWHYGKSGHSRRHHRRSSPPTGKSDFWGTAGVQITTTEKKEVKTGYFLTADTSPHTNIPTKHFHIPGRGYFKVGEFIPPSIYKLK